MDREHGNESGPDGSPEAAPHISMEIHADSARVTNLTMEGTRLVLTIEAELSGSQVKATGARTGPRPARIGDTQQLADPALPPSGQGEQPPPVVVIGEKRLEKAFVPGSESGDAGFGPAGGSGGAGLSASSAPRRPDDETNLGSAGDSVPEAKAGEVSYEHLEDQIRIAKSRGTAIRAERPFGELSGRKTAEPDGAVSMSAEPVAGSGDVPEKPQSVPESENDTRDIVFVGVPGASLGRAVLETEGVTGIPVPGEMKNDSNTSTQPISYANLPGGEDEPKVFGDNAAGTAPASVDARAADMSEIADDVLESLPPLSSAAKPAGQGKIDAVIRVEAADLDDELALSDESSAIGGERHGEPQPAMVFGCEALTVETSFPVPEAGPSDDLSGSAPAHGGETSVAPAVPMDDIPVEPEAEPVPETAPPLSVPEPGRAAAAFSGAEAAVSGTPAPEADSSPGEQEPVPATSSSSASGDAPDERPMTAAEEDGALSAASPESAAGSGEEPVKAPVPRPETDMAPPSSPAAKEPTGPRPGEPGAGTTVLIRYTCPKCKTQGMQAVDKVGTVVNCSNCGKAMRLVMRK